MGYFDTKEKIENTGFEGRTFQLKREFAKIDPAISDKKFVISGVYKMGAYCSINNSYPIPYGRYFEYDGKEGEKSYIAVEIVDILPTGISNQSDQGPEQVF